MKSEERFGNNLNRDLMGYLARQVQATTREYKNYTFKTTYRKFTFARTTIQ